MNLSFEKLAHLWKCRSIALASDSPLIRRFERVYAIVGQWTPQIADLTSIPGMPSAKENDIPATPWSNARQRLVELYAADPQLQSFESQIAEVEELLLVESKYPLFRIASNAQSDSHHETKITTVTQLNPESYYASYNYPFEIIRYFQACKPPGGGLPQLNSCADEKFATKFLWMLANREDVLPILSLESFYALAPLFHAITKEIAWGAEGYHWSLPLAEFIKHWPAVSSQVAERITLKKYADLEPAEKLNFTGCAADWM